MPKIIDISVPLSPNLPVWSGDGKMKITKVADMKKGDYANVSHLQMGSHTGTHIDAPLHFVANGKTTEEIPLEKLIGSCYVLDCRGLTSISADDLEKLKVPFDTKKLLFKTDNSKLWDNPEHEFYLDFCALTNDAAQWIVDRGIELVGIDYLSIQLYHDPMDTHVTLLSNEVVIVENLDLRFVAPGDYKLICLPLKIKGVEGTLARAILEMS